MESGFHILSVLVIGSWQNKHFIKNEKDTQQKNTVY